MDSWRVAGRGYQAGIVKTGLVVWLAIALVPVAARGEVNRYAIVVGISEYPGLPAQEQLRFAHRDAQLFSDMLRRQEFGAFPDPHVLRLTNAEATRARISEAIRGVGRRATFEDVVYVFFAGHGVVDDDGRVYFLPADANREDPSGMGFRADRFLADIRDRIDASRIVFFLDVCHAAAAFNDGRSRQSASVPARLPDEWNAAFERGEMSGFAFLSAAANQLSYEDDGLGHGIFTHYVALGLRGEADREPFGDNDGAVTAGELREYLGRKVEQHARQHLGKSQSPTVSPTFDADFPLAYGINVEPAVTDEAAARRARIANTFVQSIREPQLVTPSIVQEASQLGMLRPWMLRIVSDAVAKDAAEGYRRAGLGVVDAGAEQWAAALGSRWSDLRSGVLRGVAGVLKRDSLPVPAGLLILGCPEGPGGCEESDSPARTVEIREPFRLMRTEATQELYAVCVRYGTCPRLPVKPGSDLKLPVTHLARGTAEGLCRAFSGRLPTEDEWEAGAVTAYAGTVTPELVRRTANAHGQQSFDSFADVAPVASMQPAANGAYDLFGNAAELTASDVDVQQLCPRRRDCGSGLRAVTKGGSFLTDPRRIRLWSRGAVEEQAGAPVVGVRCLFEEGRP